MTRVRQRSSPVKRPGIAGNELCNTDSESSDGVHRPSLKRGRSRKRFRVGLFLFCSMLIFFSASLSRQLLGSERSTKQYNRRLLRAMPSSKVPKENPIRIIRLSDGLRDSIFQDVIDLQVNVSNREDLGHFIEQAKKVLKRRLYGDTIEQLRNLHNASSAKSAILFQNLPTDPYVPPTPSDGSDTLGKTTYVAEALLLALGELSETKVVGYASETEYSNPWIHEGFARNSPGSALTRATDLSFHQDMSYQQMVPDLLGLVCVREGHDMQVKTELIDNREILHLLPVTVTEILRQPRFQIKASGWVDSSWAVGKEGRSLVTDGSSIHLPVDWENMVGLDDDAENAVDMLKLAISKAPMHSVHFTAGDLLLFSNKRTVHARSLYSDLRFDGGDRVLDRAYFLKEAPIAVEETRMI